MQTNQLDRNDNPNNNQILSILKREGVLINVTVRYWRGCKKLIAEDIGLKSDNLSDRLISLGHKRLLPKDTLQYLSLIEGRAHALIDGNTFPFLNGVGHFLPNPKMEEVLDKLKQLEQEFWSAKEVFLNQYASLRESASQEWYKMAAKLTSDPERVVASIQQSFPLPRQMHRYFDFQTNLFQISLPEKLSMEILTSEEQQQVITARQKAVHEAAEKIRRDTEIFVYECITALREQTAKLCEDMLHSISGSDKGVHQKTLNRLIHFIDQFKQMNFANDTVMESQLDKVRKELLTRTAEEYRDSPTATASLVQGLTQLADHARQLCKEEAVELVQRFGSLGKRKFHLAA